MIDKCNLLTIRCEKLLGARHSLEEETVSNGGDINALFFHSLNEFDDFISSTVVPASLDNKSIHRFLQRVSFSSKLCEQLDRVFHKSSVTLFEELLLDADVEYPEPDVVHLLIYVLSPREFV